MFHRVKTDEPQKAKINDTVRSDTNKGVENRSHTTAPMHRTSINQSIKPSAKMQSYLQVNENKDTVKPTHSKTPEIKPKSIEKDTQTMPQSNESKSMTPANNEMGSSPYQPSQRPGMNKGYTPAYASPYAQVTNTPSNNSNTENDRKLTIGRGITMSGEINSCDHLYVEGTVEAALKGAQMLDVAETGVFYGSVEIEEATISGRFEGEMTVTGRLTIEATGIVTGTISYGEIQLEAGATIDGRMTPLNAPQPKASSKTNEAPTQSEQQNNSGEAVLFEKQNVKKEMSAAE